MSSRTPRQRAPAGTAQRRRALIAALAAVAVVVVVLGALIAVKLAGGAKKPATAAGTANLPASVVAAATAVPAATLDAIGPGTASTVPRRITASPLSSGGKPRILYVGAEYCPFCAAERWPVVVALSRFGTWHHLPATRSAHDDLFPDTATVSFHDATYTSSLLSFTGVETTSNVRQGNSYAPLDRLSAADREVFARYDAPPYVAADSAGSIPFVALGGQYVISGASYSPEVLAGKDQAAIAGALTDPASPIARSIGGTANLITAAICELTGAQPAAVCSSTGVQAAGKKLDAQ